jgi:hypothetical protein
MKGIIVKWMPEDSFYKKAMIVVYSDHDRFVVNSRFDFGFLQIANDEGFIVTVLP